MWLFQLVCNVQLFPCCFQVIVHMFVFFPIWFISNLFKSEINHIPEKCVNIEEICIELILWVFILVIMFCNVNFKGKLIVNGDESKEHEKETKKTSNIRQSVINFSIGSLYINGYGGLSNKKSHVLVFSHSVRTDCCFF